MGQCLDIGQLFCFPMAIFSGNTAPSHFCHQFGQLKHYNHLAMSSPDSRNKVLQMMSAFATMRFELIDPSTYHSHKKTNKNLFTRFSRSQPKHPADTPKNQKSKQPQKERQEQGTSSADGEGFGLKFLDKLSDDTILVGNQYQLDLLKIGEIFDDFIEVQYKWSLQPQTVISSVSVEQKYGFIAVGEGRSLQISKYNSKRENQLPRLLIKTEMSESIQQIRFVKNLGLFVVFAQKIQFNRLSYIDDKLYIATTFLHSFDYGPNFKLYFVPHSIENSLNLYFYENKVKKEQASKFGLWMQTIEAKANTDTPTMGKLTLIYSINVNQRKQFRIYNYSKEFCLIKFPQNIIAVKNGYVIDQAYTNFRKENSFIEYVEQNHSLIHYRSEYIDVYRLSMNSGVKPERIVLDCVDSFKFQAPENSLFYQIIGLKSQQYAIFYQQPPTNLSSLPQLLYSFSVSYQVDLKKKIDHMCQNVVEIQASTIQDLSDKCYEAQKFGLTSQEAFYEFWKRSNKASLTDFQILIGTKDFKTIQQELEKKLIKQSISVRQLIKIYTQSLAMLRQKVFSPGCTVQNLIEYSSCHFLLKKFELYRFLCSQEKKELEREKRRLQSKHEQIQQQLCEKDRLKGLGQQKAMWGQCQQVLIISIKEFKEYSEMQILNELAELMSSYLSKKAAATMKKIKAILTFFKLTFKMHYMEIIETIIKTCKLRILEIIEELPELLPYHFEEENFSIGLWTTLTQQELDQNLFLSELTTIENKDKVQEFSRHIWFKRYRNTSHGVIGVGKQQFQEWVGQKNNHQAVFYRVFLHLYGLRTYNQQFKRLILHVETHYKLLPRHLNGRFELYIILYEMFQNINREHTLETFLRFKQFQLFKIYFEREKIEKNGFILKKIMPLYHKVLRNGFEAFNEGMFRYFSAEESSVADLKCILNKLNNEKNEFHLTAEKLYEVLIKAIMTKMKVGSSCDTPIEEILVYIENIPFPIHNEVIMTNLEYIQEINYQSEILRAIRVDMSLQQIVENPKRVIQMMVDHEITRHSVHQVKDYRSFKVHAYKILAEVQCRKSNIYGDQQHQHSLKIFIIKLMKTVQQIKLCSKLLNDAYLVEEFGIDIALVEEIVIYLYYWKIQSVVEEEDKYFLTHRQYLSQLSELLDVGNPIRCFILLSIKYAELLSFENGFRIQSPIFSKKEEYPTLNDFIQTVNCLKAKQLAQLNLEAVFRTIMSLKKLRDTQIKNSQHLIKYEKKLKVEVYEHVIVHLIAVRELKAALQNFFILQALENDFAQFNVIFPALIIEQLLPELLQNSCLLIIKLISYYYHYPLELAQAIQHLFSRSFSNHEIDAYLSLKIKEKEHTLIVSFQNPTIAQKLKLIDVSAEENRANINGFVEWSLKRVVDSSDIFHKNYQVFIMYRLMCHNPTGIAKWVWCKKQGINVKTVRSLISFMSLEKMFDSEGVLQMGRKIFEILRFKYTHSAFFNEIIKNKDRLDQIQLNETETPQNTDQEHHVIKMLSDSIELFLLKIAALKVSHPEIIHDKEHTNYELLILTPHKYHHQARSQYIYDDLDDGYQQIHDFLVITNPNKNHQSAIRGLSDKNSDQSDKLNYALTVPQRGKTRKYSEYFPEMIDVEPRSSNKELLNSISQGRLKTQKAGEFKMAVNFNEYLMSQRSIDNKIVEDPRDLIESGVHITVSLAKRFSKEQDQKQGKPSNSKTHHLDYLKQLYSEVPQKKRDLNQSLSVQSQQLDQFLFGADSLQFKLKVTQVLERKPIPAHQMVQKLVQSTAENHKGSELSLLHSYSSNQDFFKYLAEVLQGIYLSESVSLQTRLKLIIQIARLFEFQHFCRECVQMFQNLRQYTVTQPLSGQLQQMVPISLILQTNLEEALGAFLRKVSASLSIKNIQQVTKVAGTMFGREAKDQVLIEFMVQSMQGNSSSGQKLMLFIKLLDYFHDAPISIKKICSRLQNQYDKNSQIINALEVFSLMLEKKRNQSNA